MLSGSIDPIDLDFQALIDEDLSPKAQSRALAGFARDQLTDAEKINAQALGFTPQHHVRVDGADGVSEDQVRPDGEIVYTFDLHSDVLTWIMEQLGQFAPVLSGRFRHSFELFVDGVLADLAGEMPEGREFVFLSSVPYAGKIEGEHKAPESSQAPDGVFEAVAALARLRFPQVDIAFAYIAPLAGSGVSQPDTPAITINAGN
ncbi:hypothetical protein [Bradyrhizobium japonicum]|uniref:hypothetical protein n=1 Tax=Bradyrhizobium japonicum TaxID=375 RepID=UPI000693CB6E|nr:hypothetical protein [Bradyrhizobium japonicum]